MNIKSEGTQIGNISNWHQNDITGRNINIGVIDSGFAGYSDLIGTELPYNVIASYFGSYSSFFSSEHGTACAEIIHDVAPSSNLFLTSVEDMDVDYLNSIAWLKGKRVKVISSSIALNNLVFCSLIYNITKYSGLTQNYFINQLSDFSDLTDQVDYSVSKAVSDGIAWVQAAGNNGRQRWAGFFSDPDADRWHNFSYSSELNELDFAPYSIIGNDVYVILFWGVDTDLITYDDYDLYITDENGHILYQSTISQRYYLPVGLEAIKFQPILNLRYFIAVKRYNAAVQKLMILVGTDTFAKLNHYSPDRTVNLCTPCSNKDVITVGCSAILQHLFNRRV